MHTTHTHLYKPHTHLRTHTDTHTHTHTLLILMYVYLTFDFLSANRSGDAPAVVGGGAVPTVHQPAAGSSGAVH